MSDVTISIGTDNDAFTDPNAGIELARILHRLAVQFDGTNGNIAELDGLSLRDINGNTVGTVYVQ